ncbi:hypothetical protein ABZZ74_09115 [Streptomyces sp. NPDC006476]|uniref:hypothetical protein n=1 Tax=Streptomyces sp. NPDC006476 TaxID=3157175 RepID=UPI0033B37476
MGIGYKTSWPGVPGVGSGEVADALGLHGLLTMDWAAGTQAAYRRGVFVASPVDGWTPAHSRIDLTGGVEDDGPALFSWLRSLGQRLGDFQYFCTDRIGERHGWARAEAGRIVRAYCYDASRGEVPLRLGEPTDIERRLGIGQVAGGGPAQVGRVRLGCLACSHAGREARHGHRPALGSLSSRHPGAATGGRRPLRLATRDRVTRKAAGRDERLVAAPASHAS